MEYHFPNDNLVIYLFNPFGPDVFRRVLGNLKVSLEAHPRNVIILLIYPDLAPVLNALSWVQLCLETARYHVYQANIGSEMT